MQSLTPYDRKRVAIEGFLAERTIRKWERGDGVRPGSRLRIERAMANLGIAVVAHESGAQGPK